MQRWGVWARAVVCASMLFVGQQSGAQAMDAASSLSLPHDPISFQQGPGSNIASSYCLICHSAEYVYTQPPHSQERWMEIIKKMKHTFGCPIPDEQISPLARYLFVQNTVQPFPAVKKIETPAKMSDEKSGNPERGEAVYRTHCLHCHGRTGKGDGPIGKSLVPPAADLTKTHEKSDKDLLQTIRNGRPGTAMPSLKQDLSVQEILDVLSYIRSLSK